MKAPSASKDFLAWHYESNGIYSARSAYKLGYSLSNNCIYNSGTSAAGDNTRKLWNLIWNASVPNKVRIFGWRAACDNLATKRNKNRRNLEVDST